MNTATPIWNLETYQELCQRARGTSVNEKTLLATDYLNCLNEICMLLEMVPDAPDCLEDCRNWQLLSYAEHFQQSHIADAKLALEAYEHSPPEYRQAFEETLKDVALLVDHAVNDLESKIAAEAWEEGRCISEHVVGQLHDRIAKLGCIINGQTNDQELIDQLLGKKAKQGESLAR